MVESEFQQRLSDLVKAFDSSVLDDEDRDAHLLAWDEFMLECSENQIERANALLKLHVENVAPNDDDDEEEPGMNPLWAGFW